MSFLNTVKDPIVSKALKFVLDRFISDFGTVSDLSINSDTKAISLALQLKGEPQILRADILKYEIVTCQEKTLFVVREFSTSREWIELALRKYLPQVEFEIPKKYESIVRMLA